MIYEELQNCIDNIYKKLENTNDSELKKLLNKLQKSKITNEQKKEMLHDAISFTISMGLAGNINEQNYDLMFNDIIGEMISKIPELQTKLTFKVYLEDHPEIWREISIPQSFNLAELCYVILSSFKMTSNHLFKIKYRNLDYFCDPYESYSNELFASEYPLSNFKFQKGSKLELNYDFGENYMFIVEYVKKERAEVILNNEDIEVTQGNGYGIIEDDHYLLDLYLDNREKCKEYLEDMGLSEEEFFYDVNDFDIDENTSYVIDDFLNIKNEYENPYNFFNEVDEDEETDEEEIASYN